MTKIKICGNTRSEDVELAVELGADLLGFIFTRSKRQVRVDEIKGIIAQVPAGVERVGVFIDETPEEIGRVAQACGLTAIQVYRPLTDTDRSLGLLLLPAFRVPFAQAPHARLAVRVVQPTRLTVRRVRRRERRGLGDEGIRLDACLVQGSPPRAVLALEVADVATNPGV